MTWPRCASSGSSSAEYAAIPDVLGGSGENQASRLTALSLPDSVGRTPVIEFGIELAKFFTSCARGCAACISRFLRAAPWHRGTLAHLKYGRLGRSGDHDRGRRRVWRRLDPPFQVHRPEQSHAG